MILRLPAQRTLRRGMLRVASLLFLTLVLLLVTAGLWLPGIGHWLAQPPRLGQVDAIVILSGNRQRILHGVTLYERGLAPELWHTGCAQSAAQLARERGVPARAIYSLATTSTWEDGQQIRAFAEQQQVNSILVVTNWVHSRRALCVIQQQFAGSGVSIYYDPPPASGYGPDNWWRHKRGRTVVFTELAKIGLYWGYYGLAPWRC